MQTSNDSRKARTRGAKAVSAACAFALIASLAFAGSASAAGDELSGGSVSLQLKNGGGMKLKPKNLKLTITGGTLDPVTGEGSVDVKGKFTAKKSGKVRNRLGRPGASPDQIKAAKAELSNGTGILKTARLTKLGTSTVQKLAQEMRGTA